MRRSPWIGVALVSLILFVRKPDAFLNPQLWAEDGSIFFTQQVLLGARAHLQPYAGYFNEVPRLVASLATLLPHLYAPAVYNCAALLVLAGLVWKLYSPRLNLPCPPAFALAVVLVPHLGGEVFVSLANVQWVLALLLLAVVLQQSPVTRGQALGDSGLVLLTGLTGPFIFFAFPLLGWKFWRHRSRLDLPILATAVAAAAVQARALSRSSIEAPPPTPFEPDAWGRLLGQRLIGSPFLGVDIAYSLPPALLIVAGLLLLAGMLWALRRFPEALERAGLSLLFAAFILAGMFVKFSSALGLLLPPGNGSRYFFIPYVVTAWCLLLIVFLNRSRMPRALASAALLAMLGASLTSGFQTPALEDLHWEDHAGRIGGPEKEVWIPINPQGWMVHIPQ